MNNLEFQCALYNLLRREIESIKDNSYKLEVVIENSKNVGLFNIDSKINNEYEIDRSKLISKIKSDDYKNLSIQGGAGSGKSVLCKKIVEGDEIIIYARAERFCEETDINQIWGFNVRETLELLNEKPIVFFIDSLEFIADIPTKLDLLCSLYEYTKQYPTAKIITSCRSNDKNAFIKIERNYNVHRKRVPISVNLFVCAMACRTDFARWGVGRQWRPFNADRAGRRDVSSVNIVDATLLKTLSLPTTPHRAVLTEF